MATTPVGNPYVESSDLVANYPATSLALANRLDVVGVNPFADAAARATAIPSPVEGQMSSLSDVDSVEIYDGSAWNPVAGGKILQVVSTAKTDTFTTTSSSFIDITGISATITPSSSANKVLIVAQITLGAEGQLKISGGNTGTYIGDAAGSRTRAVLGYRQEISNEFLGLAQSAVMIYLDSPATTSATTYTAQIKASTGANAAMVNRTNRDTDNSTYARGASSITVLEVSA